MSIRHFLKYSTKSSRNPDNWRGDGEEEEGAHGHNMRRAGDALGTRDVPGITVSWALSLPFGLPGGTC